MERMKKTVVAVLFLFGLSACESTKITPIEGLTLVSQAIESSAQEAGRLLDADKISAEDACKVEVYGRLANNAVEEGRLAWYTGNREEAVNHLQAARKALTGLAPEVVDAIKQEC